jgi:hypothetical protein
MAGKKNESGGTATLTPLQEIQQAEQEAAQVREDAINKLNDQRNTLVEQLGGVIDQIVQIDTNLEEVGVEEFEMIDVSDIAYSLDLGKPTKAKRRSSGGSSNKGGSGPRGSKPTTLPNAIMISMAESKAGTQFGPGEVHEAVCAEPVSYPFSGEVKNQVVQIAGQLGSLVKSGHVERPERGVYVLTSAGRTAAKAALKEMNEKAEG